MFLIILSAFLAGVSAFAAVARWRWCDFDLITLILLLLTISFVMNGYMAFRIN